VAPIEETLTAARQHHQAGRLHEARQLYQQILQADPSQAQVWYLLGALWASLAQPEEAIASFRQALRHQPEHVHAQNHLGTVLAQQGKLAEAAGCFGRALRLNPGFSEAQRNLQQTITRLRQRKRVDAVAVDPQLAEAHHTLGLALARQGKPEEAEDYFRQAIQLRPNYPEAHNNLGVALVHQGRLDEAIDCFRTVLRLTPDHPPALHNLGKNVLVKGNVEEALACFDRALQLDPEHVDAHLDRATLWLMKGDFERGWREYEWRWRSKHLLPRPFPQPLWDGSSLKGRTILLHGEQGLGDVLQFVRYAPLVKEHGGHVIVEVPPALMGVLASCPGIDRLIGRGSTLPSFDVHAPLMSLPRILGTTLTTIPAAVPYLWADGRLVEYWRGELAKIDGFKVGIAWKGSARNPLDRYRSIPLACFEALARVEGVRLISLQKGEGCEQLRAVEGRFSIIDLGSRLDEAAGPFMDTAAVMKNLDLVIACDSAIVHLAGALGVRAWAPLALSADWRWLLEREDSPWYPKVRLFRQRRLGDWDEVFGRMAEAL
jgi:tetratricopeptide (TPR) repeat protein